MTKIDETKQYKFSEIVRMIEDKELPEGTRVSAKGVSDYLLVAKELNINKLTSSAGNNIARFNFNMVFSRSWTIKLPKEDKFYLKAPESFERYSVYLNYDKDLTEYSLGDKTEIQELQTKFTQSEISAMPFKTSFFKQIKVDEE